MSYNTISTADAYFIAGFGYDKWALQTDTVKNQALNSAQKYLDLFCNWYGYKCDYDQENAFPRSPYCPDVPDAILEAEAEIAFAIVDTGSTSTTSGDSLEELKAGSATLKFRASSSTSNPLINDLVVKLLCQYGTCGGGGNSPIVV